METIRFCPECGHVGPIDNTKHISCCPDGSFAVDIPARVANHILELEGEHARGVAHACALLSGQVYDSDGQPLDLDNLSALCDHARAAFLG